MWKKSGNQLEMRELLIERHRHASCVCFNVSIKTAVVKMNFSGNFLNHKISLPWERVGNKSFPIYTPGLVGLSGASLKAQNTAHLILPGLTVQRGSLFNILSLERR